MTNDDCNCGVSNGIEADFDEERAEFPWQVQILREENGGFAFACSGSLVGRNSVITAAHCFATCPENVKSLDRSRFKIVVGVSDMRSPRDNLFVSDIVDIHVHPKFDFGGDFGHPRFVSFCLTFLLKCAAFMNFSGMMWQLYKWLNTWRSSQTRQEVFVSQCNKVRS